MNKNTKIILLLIILIPMLMYFSLTRSEINSKSNKVVQKDSAKVIKFSSKMCSDCQKMEGLIKEVFPAYGQKIELIEINVQKNDSKTKEYLKQYKVTLVPTIFYFDKSGKEVLKTEGYVEKSKFIEHLESITK